MYFFNSLFILLFPLFLFFICHPAREDYREIKKNKPLGLYFSKALLEGVIFGGAYLRREILSKSDWASIVVCSKFIVFALFYLVHEGNFPSTSPWGWGAYIWRGFFFRNLRYVCKENLSMKQRIFSPFLIMLPLKNPLRNLDGFCLLVCLFLFAIYTL